MSQHHRVIDRYFIHLFHLNNSKTCSIIYSRATQSGGPRTTSRQSAENIQEKKNWLKAYISPLYNITMHDLQCRSLARWKNSLPVRRTRKFEKHRSTDQYGICNNKEYVTTLESQCQSIEMSLIKCSQNVQLATDLMRRRRPAATHRCSHSRLQQQTPSTVTTSFNISL